MVLSSAAASQDVRWGVVTRNDAAVEAALARGECDGLLPDDWGLPDDWAQLAVDLGVFARFGDFPDRRTRREPGHSQDLYCRVLLAGMLQDARSLEEIGTVVFSSATVLDQLGFNLRATRAGGGRTGDARPFDMEAVGDAFAKLTPADFADHQQGLARWLRQHPLLGGRLLALDGVDARIPRGHHSTERHWKAMVLSVLGEAGALPLHWHFGPAPKSGETTLAKPLLTGAIEAGLLRPGDTLLEDAGFVDGPMLRTLDDAGVRVILRLRENMDPAAAAIALARFGPTPPHWQAVALPKRPEQPGKPALVRRAIAGFRDWPGWDAYGRDIAVCLVRDTYADGTVGYWVLMSTDPTQSARAIYGLFGRRWQLEETFMALARYHYFNALGACRDGVALAKVHFLLLAYTIRALCRQEAARREAQARQPTPWRRVVRLMVVYAGAHYGLLRTSVVMEAFLAHPDRWQGRVQEVLAAIRYLEEGTIA